MSLDDHVYVYGAIYPDRADAELDYEIVKDLYWDDVISTYDAAIVGKDTHGHVHKREKPTQHGVAIGALLGVLFPGAAVGGAVVGGIAGGLAGHFSRGMSRKDMHDLGKTIEEGEWALVVLAKSRIDQYVDRVFKHAAKQIEKEIKVDRKEFEKAPSEEFEAERELATL